VIVSAQEIVDLMAESVPEGGRALERQRGVAALDAANEIAAALMSQFEQSLGNVLLWEQFLRTPQEVRGALLGVIQRLIEQDAALASWLEEAMARYRESVVG
jgi:hypothetical protein